MNRALTASAATGSLSALVWQVVHEFFQQPVTCPVPEVLPSLVLESPAAFTFNSLKELSIDGWGMALSAQSMVYRLTKRDAEKKKQHL